MSELFKKTFEGFGWEILDDIRQKAKERIDDAVFEERMIGIKKAVIAMAEAGVDEETVMNLLQKHWDLRLSEAKAFVENEKEL